MRQFKRTKDCVAALSIIAFIAFGSLLRKVWPPLAYVITICTTFLNLLIINCKLIAHLSRKACLLKISLQLVQ